MISRFFIERPILANVLAVVTIIIGIVSYLRLPVEQYPPIAPPTIQVIYQVSGRQCRCHRGNNRSTHRAGG